MKRSMLQVALFALFLLFGHAVSRANLPEPAPGEEAPVPPPMIVWEWDAEQPKLVKIKDNQYKLTATGRIVAPFELVVVDKDSEFRVYVALPNIPDGYPAMPTAVFPVTSGKAVKQLTKFYHPVEAITTIDGKVDGGPFPFPGNRKVKVVPVLTFKTDPVAAPTKAQFDPAGIAIGK
jgi:hypothetical protein